MSDSSHLAKLQRPSFIYDFCSWLVYHPIRMALVLLTDGNLNIAMRIANVLGELEFLLFKKRNDAFVAYLENVFRDTPLCGRERELAKKCLIYRHKRALGMLTEKPGSIPTPLVNPQYLALAKGRGACFTVLHFGYHYSAMRVLQSSMPVPVYAGTVLEKTSSRIKNGNNKTKLKALRAHAGNPVDDRDQFLREILPAVAAGNAGYLSIIDAFSSGAKLYSFLGGQIMLSIVPIAKFAIKNNVPILPYFVIGDRIDSRRLVVEAPLDPSDGANTIESIEKRLLSVIEQYSLENPEMVDWFLFWKRVRLYKQNIPGAK
ncbi:MAG: hypothetical protein ACP5SH_04780 [Syntrophobacteraceae bacterium]